MARGRLSAERFEATTAVTSVADVGERSRRRRLALVRFLVALRLTLGTTYVVSRWLDSVNWGSGGSRYRRDVLQALDADRADEAQAIMPMATAR